MARSNRSIFYALLANIAIGITKFVAGGITKSAAMISEGVHSMVDCMTKQLNDGIAAIKDRIKKEFPKINYIIIQPEE
jgi:divalent metal cation (Fe/Co/Zn/Cd) transporter